MSDVVAFSKLELPPVLHWYDFLCPFCYVGQSRTAILRRHGLDVIELPFQAHPDIPFGGVAVGPRNGSMYSSLEREAEEVGLALNWPARLPDTRRALAAAEWVRQHQPNHFAQLQHDLFVAHFVFGEDLGSPDVIDRHVNDVGIDPEALRLALADGTALERVEDSEALGRRHGVHGTPAWLLEGRLISGLFAKSEFEHLAVSNRSGDADAL